MSLVIIIRCRRFGEIMAKIEPAQVDVCYTIQPQIKTYIDGPQGLSRLNRRLYRAGREYLISGFSIAMAGAGDAQSWTITKIPEGYVSRESWNHAFDMWRKQRAETLDTSSQVTGRWSDFKVYMDEGHFTNPDPLDGLPTAVAHSQVMSGGAALADISITGGEWNYSQMVYYSAGAAVDLPVGMLGADNTPLYGGIIEAWGDTRRTVLSPDPNTPGSLSTSWLEHMGPGPEDLESEVENLIESEGDQPPYAIISDPALDPIYVGGEQTGARGVIHGLAIVPITLGVVRIHGGIFPLGQFCIYGGPDACILTVHYARGDYKGVAARSMIS